MGKAAVLGAGAAVGALFGMATKAADTADKWDKLSLRTEIGVENLQRWGYAAGQSGADITVLETGIKKLSDAQTDASNGSEKAMESFTKLGISMSDLATMTPEQSFEAVMNGLASMEEGAEKNSIGNDLLGKSYVELKPLIAEGADGMQALKDRADELGLVMSEEAVDSGVVFGDTLDDVKNSLGMVVTEVGVEVMPILQKMADWLIENMPAIKEAAESAFNKIGDAIKWVQDNSNWLIPILAGMLAGFVAFKIISGLNTLFLAFAAVQGAVTAAGGLMNAVMALNPFTLVAIAIGVVIAAGVLLYKNWDVIKEKAAALWSGIKDTFDKIKTGITEKINGAKDAVEKAINKIKGFFDFKFKWPELKMPTFSIQGSMNPLKWLEQGVPRLKVNWNAEGAIFDKPTIFNTPYGMQGVGEAGPEAVAPISKLQDYIRSAVADANGNNGRTELLLEGILKSLSTLQIVLDTGVIAGAVREDSNHEAYRNLGGVGVV